MYRTLAFLCLVAAAVDGFHITAPVSGLKIKDGGGKLLVDLALSNYSASCNGYTMMNRPRLPPGFCPMQLWCRRSDRYRLCILTDETGDVAGLQYNIPCDDFTPTLDMREQGFIIWTTTFDHAIVRFYAFFQLFVPPDAQQRIDSKDPTIVLRDTELHYSGFGGEMATVATDYDRLHSSFTKQNCIDWYGQMYNYNMTSTQECSASLLSPFSVMFDSGRLVATRVFVLGHFIKGSDCHTLYEKPNAITTKFAVPNGPNCLYDNVSRRGAVAMTFFFTNAPFFISCKKH